MARRLGHHRQCQVEPASRRLDGRLWAGIGAKAKTLPDIPDSHWPIGAADIGGRNCVILSEGQPDFCATFVVAEAEGVSLETIAPVCMTGARATISTAALPLFKHKRILIPFHNEPSGAGMAAAERWRDQLYGADAEAVIFLNFSALGATPPVKDLAEYAARRETLRPIFEGLRGEEQSIGNNGH